MNLNRVFLAGRLTRDPELRATPKGTSICQFSLAINRTFSTEGGEKRDEVFFADVEAWGKLGENVAKYMTKGREMLVEGRLKTDAWEKDGEKRTRTKIVADACQFVGRGDDRPSEQPPPRQDRSPAPTRKENLDEDVPF